MSVKSLTKTKSPKYKFKLILGTSVLKSEGETVSEALANLEKPNKVFTKGEIYLTHGKQEMKQTWKPEKVRRIFWKLARPVLAKQFESLLR
jgi:23S rRNA maturation-related 3'-5' exoribonuclease YhaM